MRNPNQFDEDWRFVLARTGKAKDPGFGSSNRRPTDTSIRKSLMSAVKRKPQVMVKITSYSKSNQSVRNHLDYISRQGDVPVYDQDGNEITDRQQLLEAGTLLAEGIPGMNSETKPGQKRERKAMHLMLSMPPGTDPARFEIGVQDFLRERFGNHEYLYAFHDDRDHYHAHIALGMQGLDGKWLRPNRSELYEWRQDFAAALERAGIEAEASPALSRGKAPMNYRRDLEELGKRGERRRPKQSPTYDAEAEAQAIEARAKAWERLAQHYGAQGDADAEQAIRAHLAENFDHYPTAQAQEPLSPPTKTPAEKLRAAIEARDLNAAMDVLKPLPFRRARAVAADNGLLVPDHARTKRELYTFVQPQLQRRMQQPDQVQAEAPEKAKGKDQDQDQDRER